MQDVPTFVQLAKLSGKAFQELLFQNLSKRELEQGLAKDFFINEGTSYLKITDDQKIVTLTPAHLDRIQRLIYLARVLGWSLTDCDWVLRTACAKRIDAAAIQKLAIIQYLHNRYDIALDELGVLWTNLKNWGEGPTSVPEHLLSPFGRVKTLTFRWNALAYHVKMDYRHGSPTKFSIHIHVEWITKYRKKVLKGELANFIRDVIREECSKMKVDILKG